MKVVNVVVTVVIVAAVVALAMSVVTSVIPPVRPLRLAQWAPQDRRCHPRCYMSQTSLPQHTAAVNITFEQKKTK